MRSPTDAPENESRPSRREARRRQTRAEIIAAAWLLVRERGLAGLALRDLGGAVGMKAQSLYSYFESKADIYDAMFHEGYLAFAATIDELMAEIERDQPPGAEVLRRIAHGFFDFCTSDPVRYQLLFQRTIPDFVPSDESYGVAVASYEQFTEQMAAFGLTDPEVVDVWTALLTGLTDQQISNDPGGDRWARVIDQATDMFLAAYAPDLLDTTT
ncbi:MAG: TetR/AcrR family transcriptional regulator [Acidimicrobiia bacterium]|nr:TetR/AcrR family transcriptional regulator [Acidimicrobiia bacterium]